MAKLTDKQKRFADEYLIDLNATQAAKRAGYKDPNIGRQLITKNNVSAYIEQRQAKLQAKTGVSQERVIEELAKIGFASITDYLEYEMVEGWPSINMKDSAEVDGSPIQEVSITKDGTFKFKLYSKLDALEKIARHLGLYEPELQAMASAAPSQSFKDASPEDIKAIADEIRRNRRKEPTD